MKSFFFILIFVLCSSLNKKENPSCLQLDILILADLSASVYGQEIFIHDAVNSFVEKFELNENGIRIGLITFTGVATLETSLTSSKDSLQYAVNKITPHSAFGSTNLSAALILALNEFIINGRRDVMKMIILITDGEPDDKIDVEEKTILIKNMPKTMIWGIFVNGGNSSSLLWNMYYTMSNRPNGSEFLKKIVSPNCYVESNYDNLVNELKKLDICL